MNVESATAPSVGEERREGPPACWLRSLRWLAAVGALALSATVGATSYRCEDAGRVTYSDVPCTSGTLTGVAGDAGAPSREDRAAAVARQKADAAQLAAFARERREDERAAALAARRGNDRGNGLRACLKLAKDARRAHDDYDIAGPRQQPKARVRMQRADEDYATLCRKKQ